MIECDGSLSVKRGIAGKEKGTIKVKKDLSAKYISNVNAWVQGNVSIDLEMVNTDLNCEGNIALQNGTIYGSQVTAAGTIEASTIGSPGHIRTVIRAAVNPFLNREIDQLKKEEKQLTEKLSTLVPRVKTLLELCGGKPDEHTKNLADEIREYVQRLRDIEKETQELENEIKRTCTGTVIVHKTIYPGTVIYIGTVKKIINEEMIGPLEAVATNLANGSKILSLRSFKFAGAAAK